VNYAKLGDELLFILHFFLEVGKTQDLPSKIWQSFGALSASWNIISKILMLNNLYAFIVSAPT
jgi:hypothetical protein